MNYSLTFTNKNFRSQFPRYVCKFASTLWNVNHARSLTTMTGHVHQYSTDVNLSYRYFKRTHSLNVKMLTFELSDENRIEYE